MTNSSNSQKTNNSYNLEEELLKLLVASESVANFYGSLLLKIDLLYTKLGNPIPTDIKLFIDKHNYNIADDIKIINNIDMDFQSYMESQGRTEEMRKNIHKLDNWKT
ncbi:MAG: hypothetical protein LBH40_03820, partial [Alphaproteobacteria bacterium]|nr:hypothetical protein [Alphaproteobacteria bacterium]